MEKRVTNNDGHFLFDFETKTKGSGKRGQAAVAEVIIS